MNTIRKIDLYGQGLLSASMILSMPFLFFYGFLAGLFILGCWQLLSAALNTYSFFSISQRKQIRRYWILCLADLALLFCGMVMEKFLTNDVSQLVGGSAIMGSVFIAGYYLKIYHDLIGLIALRNELDGLTRSKH